MNKHYKNVIVIFVFAFIFMIPYIFNDYYCHDTEYHIANSSSLIDNIKENPLNPNLMLKKIGNGFNYGTRLFYPPLPHTVVAYISYFSNASVTDSLKLTYLLIMFLSGISMYLLSFNLSKSKKIALMSSAFYMSFSYHLSEIYVRGALAESFLWVFLPLIIIGLYSVFDNKRKFYFYFILGYVGGMISHFTIMIYFTLLLIPFFVIYRKKTFNKKILSRFIIASVFILIITSPMLSNLFVNKFAGNYSVFKDNHMVENMSNQSLRLSTYLNIYPCSNYIKFHIGISGIVLLILLILKRKQIVISKFYKFIIIYGMIALFTSSTLFYWDILPYELKLLQFPWRMETLLCLSISLIFPLTFQKYSFKYDLCIILVLCLLNFIDCTSFLSKEKINLHNIDYNSGMGWQREYLPVNINYNTEHTEYFNNRDNNIVGNAKIIIDDNDLKFEVLESDTLELPRIYYLGYSLTDENGTKYNYSENTNGFISVTLDKGIYKLSYEGTIYYKICKVLSTMSIIIIVVYLVKEKYEKNKYSSTLL